MIKYLRIAVTALSLTACVLLVALWVRNTSRYDNVDINVPGICRAVTWSIDGTLILTMKYGGTASTGWQISMNRISAGGGEFLYGFNFQSHPGGWFCTVPHWFAMLLCIILAAVPWIHWSRRYSLRALLIATTLVAIGLGLVVLGV
jgi:hypothetical protein